MQEKKLALVFLNQVLSRIVQFVPRLSMHDDNVNMIKCALDLYVQSVEPRYNEPLYNEVLSGIPNDFLYSSNSKICKKRTSI